MTGILAVLLFFCGTDAAASSEAVLHKTLRTMGRIRCIRSRFSQEKHLKNFAFPMKINGIMAADHTRNFFAWHVHTPLQYSCIIKEDQLIQWDADSGRTLTLKTTDHRALKMLSETLQILFSGNVKKMLSSFTVRKDANPLILLPKKDSLYAKFITQISFRFSKDLLQLEEISLQEKNSDVTKIRFYETQINKVLQKEIWLPGYKQQ